MIAMITGTLVYADLRSVIVDVHGIGYKVYTTTGVLEKHLGEPITFWTYQVVREDALDLYGFSSRDDLMLFELLITVSGIGPKTALGILNVANPATIKKAVATEDPSYLTKVSGVGKKNAEKIVMELKNKLVAVYSEAEVETYSFESDSLEALKALGYPERDAREALKKVPKEVTDTVECVKHALKILAKKS